MPGTRMFRDRVVSMEQTLEGGEKNLEFLKTVCREAFPEFDYREHVLDHERDLFVMRFEAPDGRRKTVGWTRMVLFDPERLPSLVENPVSPLKSRLLAFLQARAARSEIVVTFRHLEDGWVDTPEPRREKRRGRRGGRDGRGRGQGQGQGQGGAPAPGPREVSAGGRGPGREGRDGRDGRERREGRPRPSSPGGGPAGGIRPPREGAATAATAATAAEPAAAGEARPGGRKRRFRRRRRGRGGSGGGGGTGPGAPGGSGRPGGAGGSPGPGPS